MTIDEALRRFDLQLRADGRSEHTRNQYARHVRLLVEFFGEQPIESFAHTDLARFLASDAVRLRKDGAARKATSANALRSSVRTFFAYLHAAGYTRVNAAALVRRARCGTPPPRGLSDDDRARLAAMLAEACTPAESRDRALFHLMLSTGVRLGSALAAEVRDLDLGEGVLRLRRMKGGEEDIVYLPDEARSLLRAFIGSRSAGPLFPAAGGGSLGSRQAHRRLAVWATRAKLSRTVAPHVLRHSFAQRLYNQTNDILLTARALCHRSLASTAIYARADTAQLRTAIQRAG